MFLVTLKRYPPYHRQIYFPLSCMYGFEKPLMTNSLAGGLTNLILGYHTNICVFLYNFWKKFNFIFSNWFYIWISYDDPVEVFNSGQSWPIFKIIVFWFRNARNRYYSFWENNSSLHAYDSSKSKSKFLLIFFIYIKQRMLRFWSIYVLNT